MQALINPYGASSTASARSMASFPSITGGDLMSGPGTAVQPSGSGFVGQPVRFWVGLVVLWVAWKFLGEHERTSINPANIHLGGYDLVAVGLSWVVFWTLTKLVVNRWFPQSDAGTFVNWL